MKKKVSGPRGGKELGVALEFSWVITFPPQEELKAWPSV